MPMKKYLNTTASTTIDKYIDVDPRTFMLQQQMEI